MMRIIDKALWSIIFMFMLLGCGGTPEAEPIVLLEESAETRTFQHTYGTTGIPAQPQRVIALGEEGLLADLLDIGVQPVVSIVNVTDDVALINDDELANTDLLPSSANTSVETLLGYNPDLIIATVFFADQIGYDRLSDIAPTVTVGGQDALEQYIETLTLFGLREQGEADVAAFEERISAESQTLNATELSVAAVYPGPNVALFFDGPQAAPLLLNKLGVTMLPVGDERDDLRVRNGRAFVSDERLDLISGERLILLQSASVDGELEAIDEIADDPLWQQLPAVQSGNIVTLDRIGYPGFRGQQALLDDLVSALR